MLRTSVEAEASYTLNRTLDSILGMRPLGTLRQFNGKLLLEIVAAGSLREEHLQTISEVHLHLTSLEKWVGELAS